MNLPSAGHFGPTSYDCLDVELPEVIGALRISCSNDTPDYLNLQGIEFWSECGVLDLERIGEVQVEQSSIYVKNSDADPSAIFLSKGIHTLKEESPYVLITFKNPLRAKRLKIFNRDDYWGKRSKNLMVEVKLLGDVVWSKLVDLKSADYLEQINQIIHQNLSEIASNNDISENPIEHTLNDLLHSKTPNLFSIHWPMIIKAFPIWDKKPREITRSQVLVTACYLLAQQHLGEPISLFNIGMPFLSQHAPVLQDTLNHLCTVFGVETVNVEIILYHTALAKKQKHVWHELKDIAETLIIIAPNTAGYHYDLGLANEKLALKEAAYDAYKNALKLEPTFKQLHMQLFDSTFESMACRVELANFMHSHIDDIQRRAHSFKPKYENKNYKIFSYWAQGLSQAPAIVKACHRQLFKHHDANDIVYLDDTNYKYYVDIPLEIQSKLSQNKTFFSDVLRFFLLCEYGGTWIDSTCYLTAPLSIDFETVERNRITAFRRANKVRISAWFFSCSQSSYISRMMKESLLQYWSHYDKAIDYFILHHIFEILYFMDPDFQAEWDHHEQPLTSEAHKWYFKQQHPYSAAEHESICLASPIHKLTYKIDEKILNSDNFYSYAIRGF
jgi:hypothetical protein